MDQNEWLSWRGDVHLFPTAPGLTYREWAGRHMGSEWGEGLLDKRYGDPTIKCVNLPEDADESLAAELLVFGTGYYPGPFALNGKERPLPNLAELAGNGESFPVLGSTVYRSFHLTNVAPRNLRPGFNELKLSPAHAFVQVALIRLFEEQPEGEGARLGVEGDAGAYRLEFTPPDQWQVSEVEFFVHCEGIALDGSGLERSWQATLNRAPDRWEQYTVAGHCGGSDSPPWRAHWSGEMVPEGTVRFRCRVRLADGRIVESPGGIVEFAHEPPRRVRLVRPESFRPFGFHENGWQQDVSHSTRYCLAAPEAGRAIVRIPMYGSVKLRLNGEEFAAESPTAGYYLRDVELDPGLLRPGDNELELLSSGGTGSYQIPGPLLILIG